MNPAFTDYIKNKLRNPRLSSRAERALLATADKFGLAGDVKMLTIDGPSLCIYSCHVNSEKSPSRISISGIGEELTQDAFDFSRHIGPKGINSLFAEGENGEIIFDDYFLQFDGVRDLMENLSKCFSAIGISNADTLAVVAPQPLSMAVKYSLQTLSARACFITDPDPATSTEGRIEIHPSLRKSSIGLPAPMDTVAGIMKHRKAIYVPMHEATLDAIFYGNMTWRRLLEGLPPADECLVEIAGIACRMVKLHPTIDAYGNLFLSIHSLLDHKSLTVIIDGPGLVLTIQPQAPTQQPDPGTETAEEKQPLPEETSTVQQQKEEAHKPQQQKEEAHKPEQQKQEGHKPQSQKPETHKPQSQKEGPQKPQQRKEETHRPKTERKNPPVSNQNGACLEEGTVVFDRKIINWKKISAELPEMNLPQVNKTLEDIQNVFRRMSCGKRIITDTNLWVTEEHNNPGHMAYRKLIDYLSSLLDPAKGEVFEIDHNVYDEINKLAANNVAAAKEAKNVIARLQALGIADLPELGLSYNAKAYADEPIGYRLKQLYADNRAFSILTNDTDALIRWRAVLAKIDRERNAANPSFPPNILCRELQCLFSLRGKLINHKNKLNNKKNDGESK